MSKKLLGEVREEIEKRGVEAWPILVGSVAKGTYLKDPDIDIFIRFSPDYSREEMEKLGLEIARAVMPDGIASYAEHPYLRGKIEGYSVDIVPCYMIEDPEKKISSVDRTPFHTEFVRANLSEEQRDEVRLLKAFMKGIGVYGAEARVQGFSGYLCELLLIKYGSFLEVLKNAAKWKKRTYLHLGNGGAKFNAPLTFIDPVDSGRNVASAVSEESKSIFILASKEFLSSPREEFFFPKYPRILSHGEILDMVRMRDTKIYAVIFEKPDIIDDALYPQIRRTLNAFVSILKDFSPVSSFFYVDSLRIVFILELERDLLPGVMKHEGPPVWHRNAGDFMERWKDEALRGPYVIGNRLYVDRIRERRKPEEVLEKGLKNYKLGKYFESQKEKICLLPLEKIINELNEEKLTEFFDFKFPWRR